MQEEKIKISTYKHVLSSEIQNEDCLEDLRGWIIYWDYEEHNEIQLLQIILVVFTISRPQTDITGGIKLFKNSKGFLSCHDEIDVATEIHNDLSKKYKRRMIKNDDNELRERGILYFI